MYHHEGFDACNETSVIPDVGAPSSTFAIAADLPPPSANPTVTKNVSPSGKLKPISYPAVGANPPIAPSVTSTYYPFLLKRQQPLLTCPAVVLVPGIATTFKFSVCRNPNTREVT